MDFHQRAEPHEKKKYHEIKAQSEKAAQDRLACLRCHERGKAPSGRALRSHGPPAMAAQLARARRVPTVRALRKKLKLTQEQFAARFHLPLGTVRDWEQGAHVPDKAAQVLLRVIANDPDAVARALES
jgi:putative transcriptional regulator